MKRILSLACAFLLLLGCAAKGPKKIKIGLSMDTLKEERWKKDRDLLEKKIKELGGELVVQVANSDDRLQNEQVENLLTLGINVLILVPHNAKTAATAVESARKAGVPVISYDRVTTAEGLDLWITFDNEKVGELQAEYLSAQVPKGNYVLLAGAPTDYNAVLFRKGQMKVLQPLIDKGDITVVLDQWCKDWQPIEALKHTENALTKSGNKVDAVVASNDGVAGGAIQALTEQKLAGKVAVSGQDAELAACQRIVAGTQSMTVYKPIHLLAFAAAEAAMKLAKKEPVTNITCKINNGVADVSCILLVPMSVDKTNLDATIVADGYLQREEIYGKK